MIVDIITIFPQLFESFCQWSMVKKAQEVESLILKIHDLRRWGLDKRGTVDDRPFGGGPGMVLRPEPIYKALNTLNTKYEIRNTKHKKSNAKVILLSPKGKTFDQKTAVKLSREKHLILICGHYEGVDERVRKYMIDAEISIGNYVLSGGEPAAMVVTDAISRLLPGVLEKEGAAEIESFSPALNKFAGAESDPPVTAKNLLVEFPHYTRPADFMGWKVPEVLLSGNHAEIRRWRAKKIKAKK